MTQRPHGSPQRGGGELVGRRSVAEGRLGGRRGKITRGSVYRPFYFPVILGGGNENIHRHRRQRGQKHVITACQEHNKVKFINIYTCAQPTITGANTLQIHTHTGYLKGLQKKTPYFMTTLIYLSGEKKNVVH